MRHCGRCEVACGAGTACVAASCVILPPRPTWRADGTSHSTALYFGGAEGIHPSAVRSWRDLTP